MKLLDSVKNFFTTQPTETIQSAVSNAVEAYNRYGGGVHNVGWDGEKYPGGFGATFALEPDYYILRERSNFLFTQNLYARGLVERLVTNEITHGLWPESQPEESILGMEPGALDDWAEDVEIRFSLWAKDPQLCHHERQLNLSQLQEMVRRESLIKGDMLVVMRQHPVSKLPTIQLIDADRVRSPLGKAPRTGNKIKHGVELDQQGRQVAYWVLNEKNKPQRIAAFGEKSKRRLSWLVYGLPRRVGRVRGEPLLSIILQSLREVDRYRDATLRKAVISSTLAMFIKRSADSIPSKAIGGGAVAKETIESKTSSPTIEKRDFQIAKHIPGLVLEQLAVGEEIVNPPNASDIDYGAFEGAMIQAIAWVNQVPPEILTLAFSSNYSASQAAINEFKIYLNKVRPYFGSQFCQPIYTELMINMVLLRTIKADGFLDSWRDMTKRETFNAWLNAEWSGAIKPSTDLVKQAKGYQLLLDMGAITYARATRELTGTKHSKNVKILTREIKQLLDAKQPLQELQERTGLQGQQLIDAIETAQLLASGDE